MDYQQLVKTLTPEIYENLRRAVELGKWPDGKVLTAEQKAHCLQAVIAYDELHKPEEERVGYIHAPAHDHCGSEGDKDDPQTLNWVK